MKHTRYGALARDDCLKVPAIQRIAELRGVSAAEVIRRLALAQDIYMLTRSNKPAHIWASWNAQKLKLSTDELCGDFVPPRRESPFHRTGEPCAGVGF